jgi:hypothetical protein
VNLIAEGGDLCRKISGGGEGYDILDRKNAAVERERR